MAASWRRFHRFGLETQSWTYLKDEWLVKSLFQEDSYGVLVTNLSSVWGERLEEKDIARRSKSLNPNVEAPLAVILANLNSHLTSLLASISTSEDKTELTLILSFSLSGLPYQWEFKCQQHPPETLTTHLVSPLMCMVRELSRRQQELFKLLRSKDKEIQDYKDNGATVSRRHLETAPFDEQAFINDMTYTVDFENSSQVPFKAMEESSSQELYRNIAMVQIWQGRKDELSIADTTAEAEQSTTGTWVGKLPTSLLPSVPPSHTHSSPTRPPTRISPVVSPSKEGEQARRAALERKLEEDKLRGKKKKRKLM